MKRFLPEEKVEGIKGLSLTEDGMGAVFDVPFDDLSLFVEGMHTSNLINLQLKDYIRLVNGLARLQSICACIWLP